MDTDENSYKGNWVVNPDDGSWKSGDEVNNPYNYLYDYPGSEHRNRISELRRLVSKATIEAIRKIGNDPKAIFKYLERIFSQSPVDSMKDAYNDLLEYIKEEKIDRLMEEYIKKKFEELILKKEFIEAIKNKKDSKNNPVNDFLTKYNNWKSVGYSDSNGDDDDNFYKTISASFL